MADQLAERAAAEHAIPEIDMMNYEIAKATTHLIRQRIATATMHALEANPSEGRAVKEARAAQRHAQRVAAKTKTQLLDAADPPPTPHELQRTHKRHGWQCRNCRTEVGRATALADIQEWLQHCSGTPATAARISLGKGITHGSHKMKWCEPDAKWFCLLCNSEASRLISWKLQQPCVGYARRPSVLRARIKRARMQ